MIYAFLPYFDSKSRKSGKLDNTDDPRIKSVKKQKFDQHSSRVTNTNFAEKKNIDTNVDNVDTESQDTSFSEETASGPIQVSPTVDYCINSHYRWIPFILLFLIFCLFSTEEK